MKEMWDFRYFSHPRQSSGNHAPKCLHFSILCAKSVIIHTSVSNTLIKTGMSVNCNCLCVYLFDCGSIPFTSFGYNAKI